MFGAYAPLVIAAQVLVLVLVVVYVVVELFRERRGQKETRTLGDMETLGAMETLGTMEAIGAMEEEKGGGAAREGAAHFVGGRPARGEWGWFGAPRGGGWATRGDPPVIEEGPEPGGLCCAACAPGGAAPLCGLAAPWAGPLP